MKYPCFWLIAIVMTMLFGQCQPEECTCPEPDLESEIESILIYQEPSDKFEQIIINLWNNSPNLGNPAIREVVIMELDQLLLDDSSEGNTRSFNFYSSMMQKVANEIDEEV